MRTLAFLRTSSGICALGAVLTVFIPAPVAAQTADVSISASVSRNCTISVSSVSFAPYDPVVANATASLDGQGNLSVACTKGVAPAIALGAGSNAAGSSRRLANGAERLVYDLYQDASRGTVWGSTGGAMLTAVPALSRTARDFPVYGRITGGQDVPAGSYSDSIVATVNF